MEITALKVKLYDKIAISDKKTLEAIYTLLANADTKGFELTDHEAAEIDKDVQLYLNGKTKGFTKEQIKQNLRTKTA